jgi:hypothetical protein
MLENTKQFLNDYRRNGTGFNQMLVTARELAEEMDTSSAFESIEPIRPRRKKRQFDYEALDQPILDAEKQFETGFVNVLLDVAIQSIENRFQLMKSHGDNFSMFYDIAGIKFKDVHYVEKVCSDLQILLTDGAHSDVSGADLKDEVIDVSQHLQSSMTPLEVYNHLFKTGLETLYPNTIIVLKILLTTPVTVAGGERSFSKLKLIKTYLRSRLSQEKLNNSLAILAIESELASTIDYDNMIDDFAKTKCRRVSFL